ncbi:penicillin-binding protein 2 [Mucilaginibacter paludis]|uniref:Penicillin-binding protein 2 n=1 Tax=Mucilaginibacter paludis DSM 18603 TaxID=714943 RepID=H1Y6W8_9SPHI|nr:penicillin-binding protein 2 [Mucilaginibacter paludis]EHQ28375.1 penicillin-binding protein 2 [Mucilaginibacter paludis DSM 18603]
MNSFFERRYIIQGLFIVMALALLGRLFYIQIIDDQYTQSAHNNVLRRFVIFPSRGPIVDRNGKLLVQNEPVYDIMVTPREVKPFDTVKFCQLLGIDRAGFDKRWKKAMTYSRNLSSAFEKQIPVQAYASFQEHLFEFPGFSGVQRSVRSYPDSVAAQFLGYIDEVNDRDIQKSHGYYKRGDYIGRTGVEKAYEDSLRGQRGVRNSLVDSKGVVKERYLNGLEDTAMVAGERLTSSLDIDIQKLGEKLMQNKVGSIVAIEPSTGEILCFVSSPTYDPNLMVGRQRGNNMAELFKNSYNPFFIRPIQAYYPPGSSFKPLDALIALQSGLITPQTTFNCVATYWAGNHPVHCDEPHGVTDLSRAIAESCNTYFCNVFDKLMNANGSKNMSQTFVDWKGKVNRFGFGVRLGVDMPHEGRGNVPTDVQFDKRFGAKRWRSSSIISLAIGQGELEATPLQLANIECIIANRGYYYKPHLIKAIGDKKITKAEYTIKNDVGIDQQYFEPVIDGMQQVVENGTARASRIPGIVMCGKTGTAQNPHGKNHSIFVAFAPRDNPKIAIAVVVENSGQGAWWAAPIASYIVEKYLKNTLTNRGTGKTPEWIMKQNLLPALKVAQPAIIKPKTVKEDSLEKGQSDSIKRLKSVSRKAKQNQQPLMAAQLRRKEHE